jgi:hypothetical protein
MSESTNKSVKRTQVRNPYLKTSKTTAPSSTVARTVEQKGIIAKVTPDLVWKSSLFPNKRIMIRRKM